jgi:hypothetical protein
MTGKCRIRKDVDAVVANLRHYPDICLEVEENHENVRLSTFIKEIKNYLLPLLQGMII